MSEQAAMSTPSRRRWFPFRLRTMFVAVAIVAILIGVLVSLFGDHPRLVVVDSEVFGEPSLGLKVAESWRQEKFSDILVTGITDKNRNRVPLIAAKAVSLIAKERQASYCVVLIKGNVTADGNCLIRVGFTNSKADDIDDNSEFRKVAGLELNYVNVADLNSALEKGLRPSDVDSGILGGGELFDHDE